MENLLAKALVTDKTSKSFQKSIIFQKIKHLKIYLLFYRNDIFKV